MKLLISSLTLVASIGFIPAAFAAPMSVQTYDAFRAANHASRKTLTASVIEGTIAPEVARVQTTTIEGKRVLIFRHFDRNMTAVETHCIRRLMADGEQTAPCLQNKVTARAYPTISKGL